MRLFITCLFALPFLACADSDEIDTNFDRVRNEGFVRVVSLSQAPIDVAVTLANEPPLAFSLLSPASSGFKNQSQGELKAWVAREGRTLATSTFELTKDERATVLVSELAGDIGMQWLSEEVPTIDPEQTLVRYVNALSNPLVEVALGSDMVTDALEPGDITTWRTVPSAETAELLISRNAGSDTFRALALPRGGALTFVVFPHSETRSSVLVITEPQPPETAVQTYVVPADEVP